MGQFVELGNGMTKYYDDIFDFIKETEEGFQSVIAENKGSYIDHFKVSFLKGTASDKEIQSLLDGIEE